MYSKKYWSMSNSDILDQLQSSNSGLSQKQVNERLIQYGPNELGRRIIRTGLIIFISQFRNPLVILLIAASIVAGFLGEIANATIIAVIVLINGFLGFFQEYRSEKALERLRKYITFSARVIREGEKRQVDTREIVPGDIVTLGTGDIVPADLRLLNVEELSVDESSLTGESYPARKTSSEISIENPSIHEMKNMSLMGTYAKSGEGIGIVVATGKNTYLGKTAQLLNKIRRESEFQKSMKKFGYTLVKIVLVSVAIIFLVNTLLVKDIVSTLLFSLALAVGMVPEALPMVVTISLSSGALMLAKKDVVVKRLVSVEDLGNIDVVCTDKTGTITENKLTLEKYVDIDGYPDETLILYSLLCNSIRKKRDIGNPIDTAIWDYARSRNIDIKTLEKYTILREISFNSNRKRMTVVAKTNENILLICKGAPEIILDLSTHIWQNGESRTLIDKESAKRFYEESGNKGYRVIAVAYKEAEEKERYSQEDEFGLTLLGYIAFMDPPKKTAKEAIRLSRKLKLDIKILTGDGPYVSKEIATRVGLKVKDDEIMLGQELDKITDEDLQEKAEKTIIFSRVTPEHKYRVVRALRKNGRVTACLGDGVNDAPAIKEADVGIAVDQGSDIAKDAADIVLLKKGLKVIVDGILEGRKTFSNIVKYILYTISGNFGDLYTVGGASAVLHFLPLQPSQLILANFLTDTPVMSVSTDNVEKEELVRPRRWDINYIFKFGGLLGLVSAIFDIILILLLLSASGINEILFRTALFMEIVLSEVLVLFIIRTDKFFLKSEPPSKQLLTASVLAILLTSALIYLPINSFFELSTLPLNLLGIVILVTVGYVGATEIVKLAYYKKLVKPRIKPAVTAQTRLLDIIAVICLRFENEITVDSLLDDLSSSVHYTLDPKRVRQNLYNLKREGLVTIDWQQGVIRREEPIRAHVTKYATSKFWQETAKNWRRHRQVIQAKHGRANPEYNFLFSRKKMSQP